LDATFEYLENVNFNYTTFVPQKTSLTLFGRIFYCASLVSAWMYLRFFNLRFSLPFILKNEIRATVFRKRRQLKRAFNELKILDDHDNKWKVTKEIFIELMNEVRPAWSEERVDLLWQVLQDNEEGMIGKYVL
jgi:hypothetical protein